MRGACMQFIWAEMKRTKKKWEQEDEEERKKGGKISRTHNLVKATIKMLKEVLKRKYAHPFGRINGMSTSSRWQFGYCWDIYVCVMICRMSEPKIKRVDKERKREKNVVYGESLSIRFANNKKSSPHNFVKIPLK